MIENRLRRTLERRGWKLKKSPRRDKLAVDYGLYAIVCPVTGSVAEGEQGRFTLDLRQVEIAVDKIGRNPNIQ